MAEEKVNKEETTTTPTSVKEEAATTTPEKKKSKTVLLIVMGIVVFLAVISIAGYLVVRGLINKGTDIIEDSTNQAEQTSKNEDNEEDTDEDTEEEDNDEDTWLYDASTEEKVDGNLEKESLISSKFPDDIPLCGGVVTSSSYDEWAITTKIETASEVDEVLAWYVSALEEAGWEITGQTSDEIVEGYATASVDFASADGERTGDVYIETSPYYQISIVTVEEILY